MNLFTRNNTTIIKAIAILCVFICHLGNQFTRFTTPLGGIGVCMFLIISGYGLEKSFLAKSNSEMPNGMNDRATEITGGVLSKSLVEETHHRCMDSLLDNKHVCTTA